MLSSLPIFSNNSDPRHYIRLSIIAAVATITLKLLAWWISGSVGLLSDAMESVVNLVAALLAGPRVRAPEGLRFRPEVALALLRHNWPLNVRELEHVVVVLRARIAD